MDRKEIKDELIEMTGEELIDIWNEYCENNYCTFRKIHYMEEFDEIMKNKTPLEIIDSVYAGFDVANEYFIGNTFFESFNDLETYIDYERLVDYIVGKDK